MTLRSGISLRRRDWPLVIISAAVLLVYVLYTLGFVYLTPYSGLSLSSSAGGWRVVDSSQPDLDVDDEIATIDGVPVDAFRGDALRVPFAEFHPGDAVVLELAPDGERVAITMPFPTPEDRLRRFLPTLSFWPFWLAGTIVLLFLQPRDRRWRLLVAFMYVVAVWLVAGSLSAWRIGGARLLMGVASWLMLPLFVDLHLNVPTSRLERAQRLLLPVLYGLAGFLAFLELLQATPRDLFQLGPLLAILGAFVILAFRFARPATLSEQVATRLMLVGIGLSFGPGLVLVSLPDLLSIPVSGVVGITLAALAVPALPLFYTYAIYKRQLGQLEFRANRLLSIYSFILLYPTIFLVLFFLGWQSIDSASGRMVYLLIISMVFVVTASPLMNRFQRFVNRLAYASEHDPADIIRVFAHQIPSVRSRGALVELITRQIVPTLLIRQSALCLIEGEKVAYLYEQGVPADAGVENSLAVRHLLKDAGFYRAPLTEPPAESDWVRLVLPLQRREETIGVWLMGKRDPDDFYPRDDVDLLQILANQIATVIENIRLYETLRGQADRLAEQVAERTSELQAERDRTQAILDSAGEGVFFTDPEGVILYVNPMMTQLTGYAVDEMLGETLRLWDTAGQTADQQAGLWAAIHDGRGWSGERVQQRKDGSTYDVNLTVSPILSADGVPGGFVGVQSDISKMKEVDRLKSNIIANVSHELKTPLTNISLYLALLRRNKGARTEEYLTVLERETKRLTQLIQNLLDLSKLDTGTIPTHLAPIDLVSNVSRTVVTFRSMAQDKHIALSADLPEALPTVVADDTQIEQVVTNLLANALNYTPQGGAVCISAGTGRLDSSDAVFLRVKDTGMGIDAGDLPHLFDRFYRGSATADSNVPGTGLGLAICKEIVDRHQGRIDVESEPGTGSVFTVWLPVEYEAERVGQAVDAG